jgi:hypothetical protein
MMGCASLRDPPSWLGFVHLATRVRLAGLPTAPVLVGKTDMDGRIKSDHDDGRSHDTRFGRSSDAR